MTRVTRPCWRGAQGRGLWAGQGVVYSQHSWLGAGWEQPARPVPSSGTFGTWTQGHSSREVWGLRDWVGALWMPPCRSEHKAGPRAQGTRRGECRTVNLPLSSFLSSSPPSHRILDYLLCTGHFKALATANLKIKRFCIAIKMALLSVATDLDY